ncbi:MAG: P-II family nitrogen regulator [Planctomycetes bacterium]|nr:P-II family nitrogen regulator [Planctomycetota bacterium]
MKMIVAIIDPGRLEAVKEALGEAEVYRLTVGDVQGIGEEEPPTEGIHGMKGPVRLVRKVKLEVAVNEAFAGPAVAAIARAGRTGGGRPGDGVIFVQELEDVIRIRTGERGPEAI